MKLRWVGFLCTLALYALRVFLINGWYVSPLLLLLLLRLLLGRTHAAPATAVLPPSCCCCYYSFLTRLA